jgi:hypothetical protein
VKVLALVATGVLLLVTSIWNSDRPPHHGSATWTLSALTALVHEQRAWARTAGSRPPDKHEL